MNINEQSTLILNLVREGILVLDLQGNHAFVNPAAAEMLGYKAEELLGHYGHSLWHHTRPDGEPCLAETCHVQAAYRDGTAQSLSINVFWRKDGTELPVEYLIRPLYEQDKLAGAVVIFTDMTERLRKEKELGEALTKLKSFGAMLPICSSCKKFRDKDQRWHQPDAFLVRYMGFNLTHGICPECIIKLYPEFAEPTTEPGK